MGSMSKEQAAAERKQNLVVQTTMRVKAKYWRLGRHGTSPPEPATTELAQAGVRAELSRMTSEQLAEANASLFWNSPDSDVVTGSLGLPDDALVDRAIMEEGKHCSFLKKGVR